MKILVIILVTCIISFNTKAQLRIFGDTCNAVRQYEGEWRNINGQDTIKVYFRVQNFFSSIINKIEGSLLGWLEYKQGDNIVLSDYSHRYDVLPTNFSQKGNIICSIGLSPEGCSNPILIFRGGMRDPPKNRSQYWKVSRLTANTIQVYQILSEGIWSRPFITGFTLPQTFVLTRQ